MPEPGHNPTRGTTFTPRYLATLVGAALLILVVGAALRPRRPASDAAPAASPSEVRRLQRLAERQSLEATTSHFGALAADVASRLVLVGESLATGVAWSEDLVVVAAPPGPAPEATTVATPGGEALPATRVAAGPDLPLVGFHVSGRLEPVPRRAATAPELVAGQWLVAVWRGSSGLVFLPGHHAETRPSRCGSLFVRELVTGLELAAPTAGAGLFDLDGALVGLVLPCDGRLAALTPESVALALAHGQSLDGRLRTLYGVRLEPLDAALRRHLSVESGALVAEVWTGSAGERAGLRPGDVIVAFDERPVTAPLELQPLVALPADGEAVLGVSRARQHLEIRLARRPARPAEPPPVPGVRLAAPAEGYAVSEVIAGSPAAAAGVRPGDRLLRADFAVPKSASAARRALSLPAGKPVYVELQSGERRFGALLAAP